MTVFTAARMRRFFSELWSKPSMAARADYVKWAIDKARVLSVREAGAKGVASAALAGAIGRANDLGYVWRMSLSASSSDIAPARLNLVAPAIDPSIIFGGYISFFQFAAYCRSRGAKLRFIVTERLAGALPEIVARCAAWYPDVATVLLNSEVVDYSQGARPHLEFSKHDVLIAYSCATARIAHNTALQLGLAPIIFYVQEEEGHFHSHNSTRAFLESTYDEPHVAIFNSEFLEHYYRQNKIGVFKRQGAPRSIHFRHALAVERAATSEEMRVRTKRKLLFFARPETHADRNLFELGLVALREATSAGVFPPDAWELHAIGSDQLTSVPLFGGQTLHFIGKFPLAEYGRRLADYDVGLSLIYTPHPSVPNFEMAAAGVVTVTNEFSNRSGAQLERVCPNFVVARATIESLVQALRIAVERSDDFEGREANAAFEWPRSWSESFDARFSQCFSLLMAQNFPNRYREVFPAFARYPLDQASPRQSFEGALMAKLRRETAYHASTHANPLTGF